MNIPPKHTKTPVDAGVVDAAGSILVVDDSPLNLQAVAAALADMVDEIVTVESGGDALHQLLRRDFAVVLLDVSMPGLDGYETARLIRSRDRNRYVPIIFLTAFDRDHGDVLRAYELGAVDFLFKPVQREVLRSKVAVFVELQRRSAEVALQAERLRELEHEQYRQALESQRLELEAKVVARQMEEQRRAAQQLTEMDERKDRFLAMLGHELRTPLAAMVVGIEVASSPGSTEEVRARAHHVLARQAQHLVRLVDDLLDVTRIGSGRIQLRRRPTTIDALIDRAIDLARPALDAAGHTLTVERPSVPVVFDADGARIVQVVSNLLHNAARYTPANGHIRLFASADDDAVRISVADNGRGIPPEELETVFDIFVRGAHDTDGLGLGLPLARTLVEQHGGTISAHSDGPGRGARFEVWLPRSVAVTAEPEDDELLHTTAPGPESCQVLLIEDDDDLRSTVHDLLTGWGHTVDVAANGSHGLEKLCSGTYDVAIVDIGLPDIDGCTVVTRAAELGARAGHMLALTGFTQSNDQQRITAAGFDTMLPKPPNLDHLRQIIAACKRPP